MSFFLATLILIGTILCGIPIGFALGISGIAALLMIMPPTIILPLAQQVVYETATNPALLTLPMFILMAEFLSAGQATADLMLASNKVFRKVRGGMAMACILAGTVLAAASGSSTASSATITRAAFPSMAKAGYAPSFAIGTISIAGTLSIMIPPSVAFVLYGLMTETSIGRLFMAGIVPGLMTAAGYIATIAFVLWWKPELGPSKAALEEFDRSQVGRKNRVWPIVVLIIIIFGGLYGGIATPTEIAAVGAFGALLICASMGRLTRNTTYSALGNTLRMTCMIITIMLSAHMFGYFVSFSRVTAGILAWIGEAGLNPWVVILGLVIMYLILGMLMDQAAIIILTAPITTPLVVGLGFDPVWWGVIMIKTAEIGLVTPPVGLNVYVASAASGVDLRTSLRGIWPFVAAELVLLAILVAFPALTLLLVW